ncbi:antibiotic biosynthesis monooxygenase family protein [Sneathiella aquimaris]|uniref:antibiotic biosynthesis monooxygenase family protein n=1 Tax=Sneathiella aquimaris TaxID=2599305 RepID=UPI00146D13D2|nr:antibiotic biosynthesis monooxygenase [Sneathiella aquimaris]
MIAIIFEVEPKNEFKDQYLDTAADLLPVLKEIKGFISVERFQSLTNPGKILSLSFFADEEAVNQWRKTEVHREAQSLGRNVFFSNYRLRIASVIRDYGMNERDQAPKDSSEKHDKK